MIWMDARLPIRFGPLDSREHGEAVLTDGPVVSMPAAAFVVQPGHVIDCTCCAPRSGAAAALAQLFHNRAIATGPAFKSVLAVMGRDGEAAVRDAVLNDPLVSARFRLQSTEKAGLPNG